MASGRWWRPRIWKSPTRKALLCVLCVPSLRALRLKGSLLARHASRKMPVRRARTPAAPSNHFSDPDWLGMMCGADTPVRLTRPVLEPTVLPEFLPPPHPGASLDGQRVAQLMRQHADLPTMMRVVRDHKRKHRGPCRPGLGPTVAQEFRHAALRHRSRLPPASLSNAERSR